MDYIYRHRKYDLSEFMIYLETSLKSVVSETCGDFNIDLLKVHGINNYQLHNLICSIGFLPLIIQPIRAVDNQHHLLSIIYFVLYNLSHEIIRGNSYLTFSKHSCQFASAKRERK